MDFNVDRIAEECVKAIGEKVKNLNKLNIIVAGKTGVGKSTLINSVFREKMAETGLGKPVTTHMRKISKNDFPLNIYDTRGFELGKDVQQEVKQEVLDTIQKGIATKDINKSIHCIWYCINTSSNRIEPEEIQWLKELGQENKLFQVPIIIVLTQSFSKANAKKMKDMILNENLDVVQVVPVLAEDYEIDEEYTAKAYGLDVLIQVMAESLPSELQDTLQNVQKVALEEKRRHAQAAIATATAAAFGEGFAPVPFSDCAVLIPTQVAMIASITAIFGLDVSKSIIMAFVSAALGTGGMTLAGKSIVSNLLKLVPGAGTLAGGAISGSTAGLLTTALGEAYILLMESVYKGEISGKDIESKEGREKFRKLFKKQVKQEKKKKN